MVQSPHQPAPESSVYRATYHPNPQDYYNGGTASTGAVPRQAWHGDTPKRQYQEQVDYQQSPQVALQIESTTKESKDKNKTMTKTYHTIKDIISSRFKSTKESEEKPEESGLNNVTEELRRSQRNLGEEPAATAENKNVATEQAIYGKPRIDPNISHQQHQYNQHVIQQQMLQVQQYQTQQLKIQQYQQQLVQARSQEVLVRTDEQMYYQNAYSGTPQRGRFVVPPNTGRDPNYQHNPVKFKFLLLNTLI